MVSRQTVSDQITLLIKDFVFTGSAAASTFGRPDDIGTKPRITELVEHLRGLGRSKSTDRHTPDIVSKRAKSLSPLVIDLISSNERTSQSSSDLAYTQFASQPLHTSHVSPLPDLAFLGGTNLHPPVEPRRSGRRLRMEPASPKDDAILGVLQNRSKQLSAQPGIAVHEENEEENLPNSPRTQHTYEDRNNSNIEKRVESNDSEEARKAKDTAIAPGTISAVRSEEGNHKNTTEVVADSKLHSNAAKSLGETPKAADCSATTPMEVAQVELPKLPSVPNRSSPAVAHNSRFHNHVLRSANDGANEDHISQTYYHHQNNFKFVKVLATANFASGKQIELLRRPESWQYPGPGLMFPSPNVPIELLGALNEQADRLRGAGIIPTRGTQPRLSDLNSTLAAGEVGIHRGNDLRDGNSQSSMPPDEERVSWSPSPVAPMRPSLRKDLPPDSSANILYSPKRVADRQFLASENVSASAPRSQDSTEFDLGTRRDGVENANSARFTLNTLPDDSSDLETEIPHALPIHEVEYQRRSPVPSVNSAGNVHSMPSSPPVENLNPLSAEPPAIPQNNMVIEPPQSHSGSSLAAHGVGNNPLSPTFQSAVLTKFEDEADRVIQQTPSHLDAAALTHGPKQKQAVQDLGLSKVTETTSSGMKRKRGAIPNFDRSPMELKKPFRYNLGLHPTSQTVPDPAVVARQARHAFMQESIHKSPHNLNVHQQPQGDRIYNHSRQGVIKSYSGARVDSPNSYQPQRFVGASSNHSHEINPTGSALIESTGGELHSSPRMRREICTTTYGAAGRMPIASSTFPSHTGHAFESSVAPSVIIKRSPISHRQTKTKSVEMFDEFSSAYPNYSGNLKHFVGLCRKIKADGKLHRSLWDDFIIRHKIDYIPYVSRCTEDGGEAIAYEQFYNQHIESPLYTRRLMNPYTLEQALAQVGKSSFVSSSIQDGRTSGPSSVISATGKTVAVMSATSPAASIPDRSRPQIPPPPAELAWLPGTQHSTPRNDRYQHPFSGSLPRGSSRGNWSATPHRPATENKFTNQRETSGGNLSLAQYPPGPQESAISSSGSRSLPWATSSTSEIKQEKLQVNATESTNNPTRYSYFSGHTGYTNPHVYRGRPSSGRSRGRYRARGTRFH